MITSTLSIWKRISFCVYLYLYIYVYLSVYVYTRVGVCACVYINVCVFITIFKEALSYMHRYIDSKHFERISMYFFFFYSLDNTTVTWVDDTYANLSDNVTQSSLEALFRGSLSIHTAFLQKLDTVFDNVGLPPPPQK